MYEVKNASLRKQNVTAKSPQFELEILLAKVLRATLF